MSLVSLYIEALRRARAEGADVGQGGGARGQRERRQYAEEV